MIEGKLSLVLPAHNEEDNIAAVVHDAEAVLPTIFSDYEVVVVNDGSKDRTGEIADQLAATNPHVRVIHHEVNRGYGDTITTGMNAAKGDYIMFTDSDRQFDLRDLNRLAPYVPHYDIVAGYRIKRNDPAVRLIYARLFNLAVQLLFNVHVRDIDCAFKVFHADVLKGINLQARYGLINAEILAKANVRGRTIVEVGVNHLPRTAGEQSGGSWKVVSRSMQETLKLWLRMRDYVPPDGVIVPQQPNQTLRLLVGAGAAMVALIGLLALKAKPDKD